MSIAEDATKKAAQIYPHKDVTVLLLVAILAEMRHDVDCDDYLKTIISVTGEA